MTTETTGLRELAETLAARFGVPIEMRERGYASSGSSMVYREVKVTEAGYAGPYPPWTVTRVLYAPTFDLLNNNGSLCTRFPETVVVVEECGHSGYSHYHPDYGTIRVPPHKIGQAAKD